MKKILAILLVLGLIAGCAPAERPRDGLPQSTRVYRPAAARPVAAAPVAALAAEPAPAAAPTAADTAADTAAEADESPQEEIPDGTRFFRRDNGQIVFHVATQTSASHPLSYGLLRFQHEVETRSYGEIEVIVHIAAGSDVELLGQVNNSELDASIISMWSLWSGINEMANLEALPFIFTNYEEAWAAYEGALGEWVAENIIEPGGAYALGFWTNGLRHFTNNVRPITTPADMQGLRMRSPQASAHVAMYEALGAQSLALPFGEVHAGLARGDFDGQDNPLAQIYFANLHEVQNYLSLSGHMFSSAPLIVSEDFWNLLNARQREVLEMSSLISARFQGRLTQEMETEQLMNIMNYGTQVNDVNVAPFANAVEGVWRDHMNRFGNEFATIASRYIADTNSLAHRFAD